jgi:hypothetical protein
MCPIFRLASLPCGGGGLKDRHGKFKDYYCLIKAGWESGALAPLPPRAHLTKIIYQECAKLKSICHNSRTPKFNQHEMVVYLTNYYISASSYIVEFELNIMHEYGYI